MSFYHDERDNSSFVLFSTGISAFHIYARGYRNAAERLAELLLERPRFSDYEAYPVVFLFRHALELELKHAIYQTAAYAGYVGLEGPGSKLQNHHDLRGLAYVVRDTLGPVWSDASLRDELLPRLVRICEDFAELDPSSMVFRYPLDREGGVPEQRTISLRTFASRMSSLLEDLDTVSFGLQGEVDIAHDAFVLALKHHINWDDLPGVQQGHSADGAARRS